MVPCPTTPHDPDCKLFVEDFHTQSWYDSADSNLRAIYTGKTIENVQSEEVRVNGQCHHMHPPFLMGIQTSVFELWAKAYRSKVPMWPKSLDLSCGDLVCMRIAGRWGSQLFGLLQPA